MEHLTFREHLVLTEARRSDLTYTVKSVKDKVERVTTALSGTESATMTRMAKRYARLEVSLEAMKSKHDEMNKQLKGEVSELFDAQDVVLTRVVETLQFTLTMAKEIKKADTKAIDYEGLAKALMELISDDLQPTVDELVDKFTKTVPAKDPPKKLSVSKEVVKEGLISGIKGWLKSIMSWATRYDKKLAKLKKQAGHA